MSFAPGLRIRYCQCESSGCMSYSRLLDLRAETRVVVFIILQKNRSDLNRGLDKNHGFFGFYALVRQSLQNCKIKPFFKQ